MKRAIVPFVSAALAAMVLSWSGESDASTPTWTGILQGGGHLGTPHSIGAGWETDHIGESYGGGWEVEQAGIVSGTWIWDAPATTTGGGFVTADTHNNPWIVDTYGDIKFYNGSSWQAITSSGVGPCGSTAYPNTCIHFYTVAVGDPYGSTNTNDVWATDTSGNVYVWGGYVNSTSPYTVQAGTFYKVASVANGAAKVALLSENLTQSGCTQIHSPWVTDTAGNVYEYVFTNEGSCTHSSYCNGGCWYANGYTALDISSDFLVGTDNNLYFIKSSGGLDGPFGDGVAGITAVGAQVNGVQQYGGTEGVFVLDSSGYTFFSLSDYSNW